MGKWEFPLTTDESMKWFNYCGWDFDIVLLGIVWLKLKICIPIIRKFYLQVGIYPRKASRARQICITMFVLTMSMVSHREYYRAVKLKQSTQQMNKFEKQY